jgi:hypothetical protein
MPSHRSRWSRRSASAGGRPISTASRANLKAGGRAALQYISMREEIFDNYARNPDFIQTYIFPGGMLLDEPDSPPWRSSGACHGRIARDSGSIMPRP